MIPVWATYKGGSPIYFMEKYYSGFRIYPVSSSDDYGFRRIINLERAKLFQQECGVNYPF